MLSLLLASLLTFVEFNVENLFDCQHDSLKDDYQYLPTSPIHWTRQRYWTKIDRLSQEIAAIGSGESPWRMPDLVALTEVENDTVMRDLTRRGPLRALNYQYVMTCSPDLRSIDVALMYSPKHFALLSHYSIRVKPLPRMRPTRDILYVKGMVFSGDTLHIFVLHAPSRYGGERQTRRFRETVLGKVAQSVDSIRRLSPEAHIIVTGDFNDYSQNKPLQILKEKRLFEASLNAKGKDQAKGTYKYKGLWASLDHFFLSESLRKSLVDCYVFDPPFLLKDDEIYGGKEPRRNYYGYQYQQGFSDHLPLVLKLML